MHYVIFVVLEDGQLFLLIHWLNEFLDVSAIQKKQLELIVLRLAEIK
jgi:hypothetical protein